MADEKEFETYVKLGRRGLIERTPANQRELVQMRGTGWTRKDSKFAPSAEAVAAVEKRAAEADSRVGLSPTSAAAAAANSEAYNALPDGADTGDSGRKTARKSASTAAKEQAADASS